MHVMIYFILHYVIQLTKEDVEYLSTRPYRVHHNFAHILRGGYDLNCYWCGDDDGAAGRFSAAYEAHEDEIFGS